MQDAYIHLAQEVPNKYKGVAKGTVKVRHAL
jgi:hypothetical protein